MQKIWYLRNLVEKGFTIINRKALKTLVGNEEYCKLGKLADQSKDSLILSGQNVDIDGCLGYWQGQLKLKLQTYIIGNNEIQNPYNSNMIYTGKEINADYIKNGISSFVDKAVETQLHPTIQDASILESSLTLKKLYSPEFKVKQGMNTDGYYVTSLMDKETGKPVKAYIKLIKKFSDSDSERWGIYLKDKDGSYVLFGDRSFGIDKNNKMITSGDMDSQRGFSNRFAGIGLRAHQIAIERMMQEGFLGVKIHSLASAFPFHYKAGFRVPDGTVKVSSKRYDKVIDNIVKGTGLTKEKVLEVLSGKEVNGEIEINCKSLENLQKKAYLEKNKTFEECPMILPKDKLSEWIERINSQPILISE